jgi:hypothetical protein
VSIEYVSLCDNSSIVARGDSAGDHTGRDTRISNTYTKGIVTNTKGYR